MPDRRLRTVRRDGPAVLEPAGTRRTTRLWHWFMHLSKRDLLRRRRALLVEGSVMELPGDMAWAFPGGVYYERNVEHWFREALAAHQGGVVYDVGARYGYYSLIAAAQACAVYAFEPASSNFAVLSRNIRRNRLDDLMATRVALGAEHGEARLTRFSSSGADRIAVGVEAAGHPRNEGYERVDVRTLDELVAGGGLPPPDLIKVDAEGGELGVLRGAQRTLAAHHPLLILEHSEEGAAEKAGYTLGSIRAQLEPHDYALFGLADPVTGDPNDFTLRRVTPSVAPAAIGTIIAVPRKGRMRIPLELRAAAAFDRRRGTATSPSR